jgi:hypothetical protein
MQLSCSEKIDTKLSPATKPRAKLLRPRSAAAVVAKPAAKAEVPRVASQYRFPAGAHKRYAEVEASSIWRRYEIVFTHQRSRRSGRMLVFVIPAKAKEYLLLSSDFFSFGALNFGGLLFKEKVDGFKIIELAAR